VKYAFIKEHHQRWPVGVMCRVLLVSRSGYYGWRDRSPSRQQKRREELVSRIRIAHQENRELYGSPRVHRALLIGGESVSRNTVAKLMREENIRAKQRRRFVPRTTDSTHQKPVAGNILDRDFTAKEPDRKWTTDITYVPTDQGWLYVAAVLDIYSRKIVGWSMADTMESELVIDALQMALHHRRPGEGLLHHSDRGVQYASDDYMHLLQSHNIQVSMSGKGDCWDNAVMESFWATLKTELVHLQSYATRCEAKQSIFEYIEVFYNRKRLHSSLGFVSPESFEAAA
jgi:transposase InsO family protein